MFLKQDDYLVLQQTNADATAGWGIPCRDMTVDEMKKLHEYCGINTVFEWAYWSMVEKSGQYDWSIVDRKIDQCRKAGMRMIMATPISPPQDLTNLDLYGRGLNGIEYRYLLSFWNPEAMEYTRKFVQALLDRHAGPDINFMMGDLIMESYLWNAPVYLDRAATEAFRNRYDDDIRHHARGQVTVTKELREFLRDGVIDYHLFIQDLLIGQHNEIWDHSQWIIALQSQHNAVFARPDVYGAYRKRWPDVDIMMMASTYWKHGDQNAQRVNDILSMYDARILVEAGYCEGLRNGTPDRAIKGGVYELTAEPDRWQGQVVGPIHPLGDGNREIEPWMYDIMKQTVEKWRVAKEGA